jgi:hypothetical protein
MARASAARGGPPACSPRALAALVALAAGGCFSDRGVAIQLDVGATGATSVELFLGKSACDSKDKLAGIACTTIAPPDGTTPLDGSIWFRDAAAPLTATVSGGKAVIQLRADEATTLPIVIAVGFATDATAAGKHAVATATLHDLAIPVNSARVVTAALTAASPVVLQPGDTRNLSEDRVLVWRKQSPVSSCVVVEHWSHGQHQRDFVVPEDDPDCDDVAAPECNPAAWHGSNAVGGAAFRPDCFRHDQACVLGELGCSDDVPGKTTTCVAARDEVCVPDTFCGGPCNRFDEPCLRALTASDTMPRVECTVPALAGVVALCNNDRSAEIDLSGKFAGGQCDDQPLLSSLTLNGFDTSASFGGAVMELTSPQKPCRFDLQWKSGPRTSADTTDIGLIEIATRQGALLVPLVLHFMPGVCGTVPFSCVIDGAAGDGLWSCAP